ncbi:MAG: class I SAM-dependent methyltransferase [Planctomycetota bacterium]|jgi:SAM-dependent methyltransferase
MRPDVNDSAPGQVCRPATSELLRRFVQAYWLRPENAFWMTIRSNVLAECPFEPPTIDVSCGDGVFSFLHAGGVFDPAFDVFTTVAGLSRVRDEHVDMFDYVSDEYQPEIVSPPPYRIDVGTDLKPALLAKADRLNLYEELIEHDNDEPLPFDDGAFQTIYCNAAYWVTDIEHFLRELARVIRPDGRIILQVKLESIRQYTLEGHREALGDRVLDILGRGRVESWPSLADRATWEARFAAADLSIEDATPFITPTHAHIWDVGLRPIAPMLVKMANALTPQTRASIKEEWVDLFCDLLAPLCDPSLCLFSGDDEPAEIQYVLTPQI